MLPEIRQVGVGMGLGVGKQGALLRTWRGLMNGVPVLLNALVMDVQTHVCYIMTGMIIEPWVSANLVYWIMSTGKASSSRRYLN